MAAALRVHRQGGRCGSVTACGQLRAGCSSGERSIAVTRIPPALAVVGDFVNGLKRVASKPLAVAFPSISNDESGARSYPKGYDEIKARTIAPKVKDFNPKLRITGIPGFNFFGTPSSKQDTGPLQL